MVCWYKDSILKAYTGTTVLQEWLPCKFYSNDKLTIHSLFHRFQGAIAVKAQVLLLTLTLFHSCVPV